MRIENPINAIFPHPVHQPHHPHGHRESLTHIRHHHHVCELAHAACEADASKARIVINALRREIDRLARGIDETDPVRRAEAFTFARDVDDGPTDTTGSAPPNPGSRSTWASSSEPAGYVVPPSPPDAPAVMIAPLLMTNTGTLIDLLA